MMGCMGLETTCRRHNLSLEIVSVGPCTLHVDSSKVHSGITTPHTCLLPSAGLGFALGFASKNPFLIVAGFAGPAWQTHTMSIQGFILHSTVEAIVVLALLVRSMIRYDAMQVDWGPSLRS